MPYLATRRRDDTRSKKADPDLRRARDRFLRNHCRRTVAADPRLWLRHMRGSRRSRAPPCGDRGRNARKHRPRVSSDRWRPRAPAACLWRGHLAHAAGPERRKDLIRADAPSAQVGAPSVAHKARSCDDGAARQRGKPPLRPGCLLSSDFRRYFAVASFRGRFPPPEARRGRQWRRRHETRRRW